MVWQPWYARSGDTMTERTHSDSLPARIRREKQQHRAALGMVPAALPALPAPPPPTTTSAEAAAGAAAAAAAGAAVNTSDAQGHRGETDGGRDERKKSSKSRGKEKGRGKEHSKGRKKHKERKEEEHKRRRRRSSSSSSESDEPRRCVRARQRESVCVSRLPAGGSARSDECGCVRVVNRNRHRARKKPGHSYGRRSTVVVSVHVVRVCGRRAESATAGRWRNCDDNGCSGRRRSARAV